MADFGREVGGGREGRGVGVPLTGSCLYWVHSSNSYRPPHAPGVAEHGGWEGVGPQNSRTEL